MGEKNINLPKFLPASMEQKRILGEFYDVFHKKAEFLPEAGTEEPTKAG